MLEALNYHDANFTQDKLFVEQQIKNARIFYAR